MANVCKLLHNSPDKDDLLQQLNILPEEDEKLREARRKIRACLTKAFKEVLKKSGIDFSPKFETQGSFVYGTLNRGERMPPQNIDLDDGCYIPLTFAKLTKPEQASEFFFKAADAALSKLSTSEGWEYDDSKDTCCRIKLDKSTHIDVPLYTMPDDEFRLMKALASQRAMTLDSEDEFPLLRMGTAGAVILPSDKVLLAHRKEDWISSDPRKISVWFDDFVDTYGPIVRRLCRYLKAWRDHHDELSKISSLSLMACVYWTFEKADRWQVPDRDDEALALVAKRMPALYAGRLDNPADQDEDLASEKRMSTELRAKVIALSAHLYERLDTILHNCADATHAVEEMRKLLGARIPIRIDLVGVKTVAAAVLSAPKIPVPPRKVVSSHSG